MTDANSAANKSAENGKTALDINQITRLLPHRFPFLFIDRVVDLSGTKRIVAIKNVSINEPFFAGHFPEAPVMPGVLVVEAMAQAGNVLLLTEAESRDDKRVLFAGIEWARFRRPIIPGDQMRIEVTVKDWQGNMGVMEGVAMVEDKLVAEATIHLQWVEGANACNGSTKSDATT